MTDDEALTAHINRHTIQIEVLEPGMLFAKSLLRMLVTDCRYGASWDEKTLEEAVRKLDVSVHFYNKQADRLDKCGCSKCRGNK